MTNDTIIDTSLEVDNMTMTDSNVVETSDAARSDGYCAAVSAVLDAAECRRMEIQKARLSSGVAAFAPPSTMTVGAAQDLTLAVGDRSQDSGDDTLDNRIGETLGNTAGPPVKVNVKVGRNMKATLTGSSFTIEPLDDAAKDIGGSHFATWQWRVTPKEAGDRSLLLKVEADAIGSDGKATELELASRSVAIKVDVSPADRRARTFTTAKTTMEQIADLLGSTKGLLLALAAVIVAGGTVYAAVRNFRKGTTGDAPTAPDRRDDR